MIFHHSLAERLIWYTRAFLSKKMIIKRPAQPSYHKNQLVYFEYIILPNDIPCQLIAIVSMTHLVEAAHEMLNRLGSPYLFNNLVWTNKILL